MTEIEHQLSNALEQSCQQIEWLLPFLDAKAKQSGDVAGLQANARQHLAEVRRLLAKIPRS